MRRYNDFVELRDALKWAYPKLRYGGTLPKLPPKNNLCKLDSPLSCSARRFVDEADHAM
jgi:hypothetical protein